jgi:hypothetical protein
MVFAPRCYATIPDGNIFISTFDCLIIQVV